MKEKEKKKRKERLLGKPNTVSLEAIPYNKVTNLASNRKE